MANTARGGDIDPEEMATEPLDRMLGPGMDQSSARRVAKAIGGIAQGARRGKTNWITGGWAPHDIWIVTTLDARQVIHDGVDRRSAALKEKEPVPWDAIVQ